MVLHDLNLASRYAHHIIAIKDKKKYMRRENRRTRFQLTLYLQYSGCGVISHVIRYSGLQCAFLTDGEIV